MDIEQIAGIRRSHPDNLMARYFDPTYFSSLSAAHQQRLLEVIRTGIVNPDSIMGAYAMYPEDYELFQPYLDQMIRDYHNIRGELRQESDWAITDKYDLRRLDPSLADSSMRVRVGRNLASFPLPGAMTRSDRLALEKCMRDVFAGLMADQSYGGRYLSLTPGTADTIPTAEYARLVAEHKMFKDMSSDPYLAAAGISADWPYGRGMYQSADGNTIIWVGEEDHLRIMAMQRGSALNDIFSRLHSTLAMLEQQQLVFAHSECYGYLTSCPTNLGTGMRASLHLPLPRLTRDGTSFETLAPLAKTLGLSVRGVGGEHTQMGTGGIVDISPRARLQISEAQICSSLYSGVAELWQAEQVWTTASP